MTNLRCSKNTTPASQRSSVMQNWLQANCPEFIEKEWPTNSPHLILLDHHVWCVTLEKYQKLQPKP